MDPSRADLYSELAAALGSDETDSHAGRLDRARRAAKALEAMKKLEGMLGPKGRERFVMQGAMMFSSVYHLVQEALR
jgi:hypothetical protein